jgi:hypothetical protein
MGRTVTSVVVIAGDAGTSSRARLALTGDAVPASVFVKMPAETTATRLMGELGRLADTETRFYSQLAPELTGLPKAYGSAFDPLTGRFVLVLEDLAADNCEFPDTLHPLDRDQAAAIVELLARLHATFWDRPPGWLYTASADSASPAPCSRRPHAGSRNAATSPSKTVDSSTTTTARSPDSSIRRHTRSCTATPIPETSTSATMRRG